MIKKLAFNFSSLSILQISNYVFPLIVFPYLVRVLGPEKYGLINFAFAFTIYFSTVVDYGFTLSATRDVAVEVDDNDKISEIFSSTLFSKILLLIPITLVYFLLISTITLFSEDILLYTVVYFSIFGATLFPNWFFFGIEKMHFIALFNIISRALSVTAIFIFVKNSNDVIIYAIINSSYQVLLGVAALLYIVWSGITKLYIPKLPIILRRIKKGFSVFSSSFAIMLYTTSNTFILGIFSGSMAVGIFTGADKIRLAYQNLGGVAGQTVFPSLTKLLKSSKTIAFDFIKKYTLLFGSLIFAISLTVFLFSNSIVDLVLGPSYLSAEIVLKILSFLPILIFLSNIFGIQIMLNLGFDKEFNRIIILAALVNICFLFLLVPSYSELGVAISMLITETFVTIFTFLFVYKKRLFNAV